MDKDKVELNWDDDKKSGISDVLRKVIATGLSSPFLSEDQLRSSLSGLNLPKEVIGQVLKGAQKSKQDVINKVGTEFSKLIQKIDLVKEFKKALGEYKISIKADIEFAPKNNPEKDLELSSEDDESSS